MQSFDQQPEGNIQLLKPKLSWEDNIKIDLEIKWEGVDKIQEARGGGQVGCVLHLSPCD